MKTALFTSLLVLAISTSTNAQPSLSFEPSYRIALGNRVQNRFGPGGWALTGEFGYRLRFLAFEASASAISRMEALAQSAYRVGGTLRPVRVLEVGAGLERLRTDGRTSDGPYAEMRVALPKALYFHVFYARHCFDLRSLKNANADVLSVGLGARFSLM